MEKREIKKVVVEYMDGRRVIFQGDPPMVHSYHQHYRVGDKASSQGHISHEIRWIENRSMWPKVDK